MSDNNTNCRACRACYACYACYVCDACDASFGLRECKGVYKSIFSINQTGGAFLLFNKQVLEERYQEVWDKLHTFDWKPWQTNGFELYKQCGNEWNKVDMNQFKFKDWDESWSDIPQEMLAYIQSLHEFNAQIFKDITGLDVNTKKRTVEDVLANLGEEDKEIIQKALKKGE